MSVGPGYNSIPARVVSDYETVAGVPISNNRGPTMVCCGQPMGKCTCTQKPGYAEDNRQKLPIPERQYEAFELAVGLLHRIEQHLGKLAEYATKPMMVANNLPPVDPAEIVPVTFAIPGSVAVPPAPDGETLAVNQDKKAKVLDSLKGTK